MGKSKICTQEAGPPQFPNPHAAGEAVLDDGVDLMGDLSEGPAAAPLLTDFCIAGIFANKNQRMASS